MDDVWAEYVNLPALGNAANERHGHAIKIWSFYLMGTFCLDPIDAHAQDGYIGIYVVLDREPNGRSKPSFSDIFDLRQARLGQGMETDAPSSTTLSKTAVMVRQEYLNRYKVIGREVLPVKRPLGSCANHHVIPFRKFYPFKGRRHCLFVNFRDDPSCIDGSYLNCKRNSLLLYVVYESNVASCKLRWQMRSRIKYYH